MLVVLGSINVDMVFQLPHLPVPGETVLTGSFELLPGGKGANQAAAAAKAGAAVTMVGCVGDDSHGSMMRQTLEGAGVEVGAVDVAANPTGLAIISVDRAGENSIIVASGANLDARAGQLARLPAGGGATLLCQNEIAPEETAAALKQAKAGGARTILNMAPAGPLDDEVLAALDVLIVNEVELRSVSRDQSSPLADLASQIAHAHDLACVLTRGGEGALVTDRGTLTTFGALSINAVDTTGAGDTFAGVLAAMLDAGQSMTDAMCHAVAAAGLCCEKLGAQTGQPDRAAIEAAARQIRPHDP
ncbi:MAG: ribokinase [Pseudomonadota bacterium]